MSAFMDCLNYHHCIPLLPNNILIYIIILLLEPSVLLVQLSYFLVVTLLNPEVSWYNPHFSRDLLVQAPFFLFRTNRNHRNPPAWPSLEEHFPEVLATVTVVRAHWSVVALYEILKPWLTEHVQQKEGQWEREKGG